MRIGDFFESAFRKGVNAYCEGLVKADKYVEKRTGKGIIKRQEELENADKKLREENPTLWIAKKVSVGTIKGLIGASLKD